jgi:hypothetical protein
VCSQELKSIAKKKWIVRYKPKFQIGQYAIYYKYFEYNSKDEASIVAKQCDKEQNATIHEITIIE